MPWRACTSTSRSARRSARTATSRAGCSTRPSRRSTSTRSSPTCAGTPSRSRLRRSTSAAGRRRCSRPQNSTSVLSACRASFDVAADAEIALEANPESVTAASLAGYRAAGANRLSFGAQSFRADELARLGRLHGPERPAEAVALARAAGFDNVSLDLMLWLPGQTLAHAPGIGRASGRHRAGARVAVPARDLSERATARGDGAGGVVGGARTTMPRTCISRRWPRSTRLDIASTRSRTSVVLAARAGTTSSTGRTASGWRSAAARTARGATSRWRNVAGTGEYIARVPRRRVGGGRADPARRADAAEEALFMGLRLAEGVDLGAHARPLRHRCLGAIRRGAGAVRARRPPRARARTPDSLDPPGHAGG